METEQVIPLFPLNVVLFPHSKYRFLNILRKDISDDKMKILKKPLQFGIILYDDRKINNTGCTADVEKF